eukprot:TRINITY_DN517_c0_g1_i1.p1 TRINITY_DN517_c0_g1~~TRINITY_DN517_c0_g1_i1.p1  ORF type:complete len:987 (+),score=164.47 TRINITY_DN517_c0_g1_i1:272-3232(+)
MLRLLNFIAREEDLTDDKSLSEDDSDTLEFAQRNPVPATLNTDPQQPALNSLHSAKQHDHIQSIQSDITDSETLTDPIVNHASQVTIYNSDQNEQSDHASRLPAHHNFSANSSIQNESQSVTTHNLHPTHIGEQQCTASAAVAHDTSEQRLRASTNHPQHALRTSPEETLYQAIHHLTSFSQLHLQQLNVGEAAVCSFDQFQNALKDLAQIMVWADQHEPALWDLFLELAAMPLLVRCLHNTHTLNTYLQAQRDANGDLMAGNTTVSPNASEVAEAPPKEKQFVDDNKSEHNNSSGSSEGHTEIPQEQFTGSTKKEEPSNGSAQTAFRTDWHKLAPSKVQSQILQAISIMVQSVSKRHSLLCLFAANHINDVLSFEYAFDDEMIAAFISTVKTITIRLDRDLLQLFFDPVRNVFPLYDVVTKFYGHHESMVRIAVRNITLAIFAIQDAEALKYLARDGNKYFVNTIRFLSRICGSVARAFELLLDDGREVRRTRTRTGIFRRKVRISDVTDRLEEIENICSYLNDVCVISRDVLRPVLIRLTSNLFLSPFFRPLASLASPDAVRARNKLWRLGNRQKTISHKTALASFDAAARCLLLSYILMNFRSSSMSESVILELRRFSNDFDRRSILHALKAMASDIAGTERVTFVSLCAIEAFITSSSVGKHSLHDFKYDFRVEDSLRNRRDGFTSPRMSFLDLSSPQKDDLERSHDEPMLMTLSDFEAPLTPSNSLPSTPDLKNTSSDGTLTPTVLSRATSSASLSSELNTSIAERTDSEGILSSFQMGEATLREALSSIVLVVRRREVRSMRVLYTISRIMSAIGSKTQEYGLCVEVCKIVLDELAGLMQSVLREKRTTIVCIERMFESFRTAASSKQDMYSDPPKLEDVLSADRAPLMASMFPRGAGKRRSALYDDAILPTEIEDADAFFVMMYAYERALTCAGITTLPRLVLQAQGILLEYSLVDSYLDKRDALISFAEAVLQHGELE